MVTHRNRFLPWLLLLFTCAFGIALSCHNMVFSGLAQMQTDPGDTRFNNYVLEHGYRWVTGAALHSSFWDPPFFYPEKNVFAYSDILLGTAPLYWLIRAVGFLPDTAYQLWVMALLGINFLVAFAVFKRIGFSFFPSLVASYLFAFSNIRIGQIGHAQLLPQFFMMIGILALTETFRTFALRDSAQGSAQASAQSFPFGRIFGQEGKALSQSRFWLVVLSASVVFQLYAGFYLGWFFVFGLFLLAVLSCTRTDSRSQLFHYLRAHLGTLLLVAAGSFFALYPMAKHYLEAAHNLGGRPFWEVSTMLLRVQSWFNMGTESWLYHFLHSFSAFRKIPAPGEQRAGVGWITLFLALSGLIQSKRKLPAYLAGSLWALIAVLALYTGRRFFGVEPWELVYRTFPGANAIRAVSRISFLTLICASFGLAYFFENRNASKKTGLCVALFLIVILEQLNTTPSYDKLEIRREVQTIATQIPRDCPSFLYTAPFSSEPSYKLHLDAMWAGLDATVPTINGLSGNAPQGWPFGDINQERVVTNLPTRAMSHAEVLRNDMNLRLNLWERKTQISLSSRCWIEQSPQVAVASDLRLAAQATDQGLEITITPLGKYHLNTTAPLTIFRTQGAQQVRPTQFTPDQIHFQLESSGEKPLENETFHLKLYVCNQARTLCEQRALRASWNPHQLRAEVVGGAEDVRNPGGHTAEHSSATF